MESDFKKKKAMCLLKRLITGQGEERVGVEGRDGEIMWTLLVVGGRIRCTVCADGSFSLKTFRAALDTESIPVCVEK